MSTKSKGSEFRGAGVACLIVGLLTTFVSMVSAEVLYTITDLGALPGDSVSFAQAINASGQVVGGSYSGTGVDCHAFLDSAGVMCDLGTLPGMTRSLATGINGAGQVVGYSLGSNSSFHGFLYNAGTMADLGTFGGSRSYASGINDAGEIVGYAETSTSDLHAFVYRNGSMVDIGTLGGTYSHARGINDLGQVVGASSTTSSPQHAFLYSGGVMTDLGTLGHTWSDANAINNLGEIAGEAYTSGTSNAAFLYRAGEMITLGSLGDYAAAYGINNFGQVVGRSGVVIQDKLLSRAFLFSAGSMYDLNALIPSTPGWMLSAAYGINDSGQIVGSGTNSLGEYRAFLLTPVPEPATLALVALGGGGVLAWRRRRG